MASKKKDKDHNEKWWENPIATFAVRVFVGTSVVALIFLGAVGLHFLVKWAITIGLNHFVVLGLEGLEILVFLSDIIIFIIFIIQELVVGVRRLIGEKPWK